ncbi:MAG: sulfite exporter TauE/SafE family protein [Gammaproteobacteria bacterium]
MESIALTPDVIFSLVIITFAYLIRGVVGFGSGLIAVPFLLLFLPLQVAVILVALLDYIASLTHGIHGRQSIAWPLLWPLLPFNIIGVLLAVYIFHQVNFDLLIKVLAVLIFLYAIYYLFNLRPRRHASRAWALPAGVLGSLVGTLFGTGGPFYVIYLQLQGVDKSVFRATFASIFLIDGCLRLGSYFLAGLISMEIVTLFLLTLPAMFLSLYLGEHLHTNISALNFQRMIGALLIISSISLFAH